MKTIYFFIRLVAIIIATLISARILIIMTNRLPGVVVALSAISLLVFGIAWSRGGIQSLGIRSRKASAYLTIASVILLAISTFILLRIK